MRTSIAVFFFSSPFFQRVILKINTLGLVNCYLFVVGLMSLSYLSDMTVWQQLIMHSDKSYCHIELAQCDLFKLRNFFFYMAEYVSGLFMGFLTSYSFLYCLHVGKMLGFFSKYFLWPLFNSNLSGSGQREKGRKTCNKGIEHGS